MSCNNETVADRIRHIQKAFAPRQKGTSWLARVKCKLRKLYGSNR